MLMASGKEEELEALFSWLIYNKFKEYIRPDELDLKANWILIKITYCNWQFANALIVLQSIIKS